MRREAAADSGGGRIIGERSLQEEELVRKAAEVLIRGEELAGEKDDAHDPEAKEATEALLATQLETDKHRFRLHGTRGRQLPTQ